ncbi:MAG: glycerol kinase [Deltaproteobacteria bacterium]|nr:glycerol kinase [Deltaproteobacteria bacterium]
MQRVLAVDQGTTATKAYTLDAEGRFEFCGMQDHPQLYPRSGWVEHDPRILLRHIKKSIHTAEHIDAIGLDNQGETVVAWDGDSGEPVYNAIVWQDQRTADVIESLKKDGAEAVTLDRAGLPLDPYFSAAKLHWILKNVPEAQRLLNRGRLKLGTSDSFFIERLTGEYATDVTTASRTSLMNLKTCNWDPELCRLFGIPMEILPEIRPTTAHFGYVHSNGKRIPLTASVVDQQAALMGHACYDTGQTKVTFGTGVFALANVGESIHREPDRGILSTVAWQLNGRRPVYAVDAGIYNAGSAVNWVRKVGLFSDFDEIGAFENRPAIERGVVFVPALSGLACPYWDRTATGLWVGLSLETSRRDLCQSVLEGIALRTAQVLAAIAPVTGGQQDLSVDGGLINNAYFCQFLADTTRRNIIVPASPDITTIGTGRFALIGCGLAKDTAGLPPAHAPRAVIHPRENLTHLLERFEEAVSRSRNWR